MAKEIERKFLVENDSYRRMSTGSRHLVQAYLSRRVDATVRLRIADGCKAWLTIKGRNHGAERSEWEYEIPVADAQQMLALHEGTVIDKTRWIVPYGELVWEVDEFHGSHATLVLAEVEIAQADAAVELPPFAGREVTGDPQYYNSTLAK